MFYHARRHLFSPFSSGAWLVVLFFSLFNALPVWCGGARRHRLRRQSGACAPRCSVFPRPDRFLPFPCRALPATLPIIQQKKDTKMCRWLFVAAVLWMPVVSLSPLPTARGRGGKTGHTRRGHHSRSFHLHSYYKAPKRKIIVKPKIHVARRDSFLYTTK